MGGERRLLCLIELRGRPLLSQGASVACLRGARREVGNIEIIEQDTYSISISQQSDCETNIYMGVMKSRHLPHRP
jgi:hypothetical protein